MPSERKTIGLLLIASTHGSYKATAVGESHWNDAIFVRIIPHMDWISLGKVPGAFWHCEGVLVPHMIPRFIDHIG
jgi:hypothetical protein